MDELFTTATIVGILSSAVRLATPYLYAAIGETLAQRSGVLNLGVDGIMLMGAFSAFYVVYNTENLLTGLLAAAGVGLLMGLLMAVASVTMKAEQGISGIGLYLFGLGLSSLLFRIMLGTVESVDGFPRLNIPLLSDIPLLGEIFFNHSILVYGAFLLVPLTAFLLNRTTWGLNIRAVGNNPQAADALGVNVQAIRYATVCAGGMLAGIGGAALSISALNIFQENLTNGLGFIAVALVYFGGWRPVGVLLGVLLFSFVNSLQLWLQVIGIDIPSDIAVMLPYILTIIVVSIPFRRGSEPAALTRPFSRGA
ncbi:MAG: ABC transporter permease [Chloroflexaceae bacterium]|nr:ABC transporter permease [Chloroflexaceae bacterium]NJO06124.1 ABC transporter permease [Chloroflexaceae bacterium]